MGSTYDLVIHYPFCPAFLWAHLCQRVWIQQQYSIPLAKLLPLGWIQKVYSFLCFLLWQHDANRPCVSRTWFKVSPLLQRIQHTFYLYPEFCPLSRDNCPGPNLSTWSSKLGQLARASSPSSIHGKGESVCRWALNPPRTGEFFFEFFRENRVFYSYKPLELFVFIRFFILHL